MEEFPPNLDDGELWLPSDIIRDVGARCHHHHHHHHHFHHHQLRPSSAVPFDGLRSSCDDDLSSNLSYVEDLARQLAGLGFLDRSQLLFATAAVNPQTLPYHKGSKSFGPALRLGPAAEPDMGTGYEGFRPPLATSRRAVSGAGDDGLMVPLGFTKPFQPQVEVFGQKGGSNGRVLQRPAARPAQRRFVPVLSGRSGSGTGVFLPRVINSNGSTEAKKEPRERKEEQEQQQQHQVTNNAVGWKKVMQSQPAAAEMGLPKDWTY